LRQIRGIKKLRVCAKKNLTTEEIKNKLLLSIDDLGRTAWHLAAYQGNLEALKNFGIY